MGEFDESAHPREETGQFTAGGGSTHVSGAGAKARQAEKGGDHAKAAEAHKAAQQAHEKAVEKHPGDHAAQAQHQAQAAQHGALAAQHEAKGGLAAFAGKHTPSEGHGEHHDGKDAHGEHEGHGLGQWVAHHLDEAKEGVHEKGEELRELEEKAVEGDPFKAAEAIAGAGVHAAEHAGGKIGSKLTGKDEEHHH